MGYYDETNEKTGVTKEETKMERETEREGGKAIG